MPDVAPPEDADQLRKELERYRLVVTDLQSKIGKLEEELSAAATMAEVPAVVVTQPELRQTLSRLIKKVAMIVQAEKVVLMLYNAEIGELGVLQPALGITEDQATRLSLRPDQGVTGIVFGSNKPLVYNDALSDPRTDKDGVSLLRVRNGIAVPLAIQQRDEEERVIDERVIGVMHVFNKRYEQDFNDDDVRLLEMLADQAAAVISNAQLYIELTEKKQELEDTFESIHSGVIVVSPRGVVRLINPAACSMLSLHNGTYAGQNIKDVVTEKAVLELFQETFRGNKELTREIGLDGGRHIYQAETSMMGDENGDTHSVVAIFNDITEIRQVERMKTAFVSTVSHELRTPLTSIKGFIATLIDDTDGIYDDETRMEFYNIIDTECDRLTRLITDLLNISRIESGRGIDIILSEVSLNELATQVTRSQQTYTDRHKVFTTIPEDFPHITADSDKVTQILDNLVGNAVKYSPDGGNVVVAAEDEGTTVRIDISDEGLGVPEHHRDKIFQRFHMVDDDVDHKAVKGTGIGLYLVKHLAQAHGGDVWLARSDVGKGSTFSVRLPKQPKVDEKAANAIGGG
ncbi:GAF domain-containing protein [bacterium]|nr:GAF domain-containing protein [bacterium]